MTRTCSGGSSSATSTRGSPRTWSRVCARPRTRRSGRTRSQPEGDQALHAQGPAHEEVRPRGAEAPPQRAPRGGGGGPPAAPVSKDRRQSLRARSLRPALSTCVIPSATARRGPSADGRAVEVELTDRAAVVANASGSVVVRPQNRAQGAIARVGGDLCRGSAVRYRDDRANSIVRP